MIYIADLHNWKPSQHLHVEFVYVGRHVGARPASPLANPYKLTSEEFRAACLMKYREWLREQSPTSPAGRELARLTEIARRGDLVLGCWCKTERTQREPEFCHGDVIREFIENRLGSPAFATAHAAADEAGRAWLDERAAIMEHDGGRPRMEAEDAALAEYQRCAI